MNLTATEYEQAALKILIEHAENDADEIVNALTIGIDREAQPCKNIRKISEEIFASLPQVELDPFQFLRGTSFVYNKTSNSVHLDTFAVPFHSWDRPVVYVTKNSTLVALPSPNSDTASLLKYDVSGTKFTLKAVGSIIGVFTSSVIDFYNGHYRIAVEIDSVVQVYVLKEKDSQLQVVGQVKGLAEGGGLLNVVKFVADKAFLQTISFDEKVSWILVSLSDPTQPRFVGENSAWMETTLATSTPILLKVVIIS